jgi:hypothetical protein
MLQLSTIEPHTLAVLKQLMAIPVLKDFYLVGGTNLALRYGHRLSVDLDIFSTTDFNNELVIKAIEVNFNDFSYRDAYNPIGIFGFIGPIKIDLVKQHYFKQIDQPIISDGIRMFGDRDLMAMKVFSILKRAQKKDFWDVAELLKKYSIQDFIDSYEQKYPNQMLLISVPQALTYFIEAEESEEPVSLKGQTWQGVKQFIQQKVSEYLR